ncbi:hypothetical protein KIW84_058109 [Lathyrus oleraceus]|uniref:Uncharacterized protein n=1 Tax=Pisum sativum TaxID=3888 RepID=A0A9D4X325_PEA|nr:hypothetical protein KIW84_058109 [Pisum sativum]
MNADKNERYIDLEIGITFVAGTTGYLDQILPEITTGQPAITKRKEKIHIIQSVGSMLLEREVKDIVDPRLQGEFDISSAMKALDTAMACVAPTSINRPTMKHVVMELKQCLEDYYLHS